MLDKTTKSPEKQRKPGFFESVSPATMDDDSPILPPAASKMKIDVAVNKDSRVWVIHDKPFPAYLEWVEFDVETGTMTFVTKGGRLQELGLKIHHPMDDYVAQANQVCVVWLEEGQIRDIGLVPMTVRDWTKH
jgi:hypothetical protein